MFVVVHNGSYLLAGFVVKVIERLVQRLAIYNGAYSLLAISDVAQSLLGFL